MKYFEKIGLDYSKVLKSSGNIFSEVKKTKNLLDTPNILNKPNEIAKLLKDKGPLYKKQNIL